MVCILTGPMMWVGNKKQDILPGNFKPVKICIAVKEYDKKEVAKVK